MYVDAGDNGLGFSLKIPKKLRKLQPIKAISKMKLKDFANVALMVAPIPIGPLAKVVSHVPGVSRLVSGAVKVATRAPGAGIVRRAIASPVARRVVKSARTVQRLTKPGGIQSAAMNTVASQTTRGIVKRVTTGALKRVATRGVSRLVRPAIVAGAVAVGARALMVKRPAQRASLPILRGASSAAVATDSSLPSAPSEATTTTAAVSPQSPFVAPMPMTPAASSEGAATQSGLPSWAPWALGGAALLLFGPQLLGRKRRSA